MGKSVGGLVVALILLSILSAFIAPLSMGSATYFTIVSSYVKNSAGGDKVYPGSRNAILIVEARYIGSTTLKNVQACLDLPSGISPSRGHGSCSPAYTLNGTDVYEEVYGGTTVAFRFHIDIDRGVSPGTYSVDLSISYFNTSSGTWGDELHRVTLTVSSYPPLQLSIKDVYWSPMGYPGGTGLTLVLEVENTGDSSLQSGTARLYLPQDSFYPSELRSSIGGIGAHGRATITFNNIAILANASPGAHRVTLRISGVASTDDGVSYDASTTVEFTVPVNPPPTPLLVVLDYGWSATSVRQGQRLASAYITIQSRDPGTISSVVAVYRVEECGSFTNGSRSSVEVLRGGYGAGDTFTLRTPGIDVSTDTQCSYVKLSVELLVYGSRNGAEYWSSVNYTFALPLNGTPPPITVTKVLWASQRAFPGSTDRLEVVVANEGAFDLRDAVATLLLPSTVFEPSNLTLTDVSLSSGRRTSLTFGPVTVDPSATPGTYPATLVIDAVAAFRDGSFRRVRLNLPVYVTVSQPPWGRLGLLDYGWVDGRAYTTSTMTGFYVRLRVERPASIRSLVAVAHLPHGLEALSGNLSVVAVPGRTYSYGDVIELRFSNINVTSVGAKAMPVEVEVKYLAQVNNAYVWMSKRITLLLPLRKPVLNLSLVDAGWIGGFTERRGEGVSLYATFLSRSADRIVSLVVRVRLPPGVRRADGSSIAIWTSTTPVSYGDVFTAQVQDLVINSSSNVLRLSLIVEAVLTTGNGFYRATRTFNLTLGLGVPEKPFALAALETRFRGNPAPLLPGARSVDIAIRLLNRHTARISSIGVDTEVPKGFRLRGIGGSCLGGVTGGAGCELVLTVDVSESVEPGIHNATLRIRYLEAVGRAVVRGVQELAIPIAVDSPQDYVPRLELLAVYWGTTAPQMPAPGTRSAPLTVVVLNRGRYQATGVSVELRILNSSVRALTAAAPCANTLAPGAWCRATLYLDLRDASPGSLLLNVSLRYTFQGYGALVEVSRSWLRSVRIYRFAGAEQQGLKLISSGWLNSWPVYPGTENATFTVRLANRLPYPVRGIELVLELPPGFRGRDGRIAKAYVDGPVQSLASFDASFTVTVPGSVKPGRYTAILRASYVASSGGAQLKLEDRYRVELVVNSLENAIELVTASWYGYSPEPGSYGAPLYVVFRNNVFPQIRGAVLEIELPKGFTCSINNRSRARIPASSMGAAPTPVAMAPTRQQLLAQLASVMGAAAATQQVTLSEGSLVTFIVPINVLVDKPGIYIATGYLTFIDQWRNVRRVRVTIPIPLLGSSRIIEVRTPSSVRFVGGRAVLNLTLVNVGTAPVYNVYVALAPMSPTALVYDNIRYVSMLKPHHPVTLSYTIVYNPLGEYAAGYGGGGGFVPSSASTLVFSVAVIYTDVLGYRRSFNTTVSLISEPFADPRITPDTRAECRGGILSVSGTVINYGSSTAYRLEVLVYAGGVNASTFVGDVDPGDQTAFKVSVRVPRPPDSVELYLVYRDSYNNVYRVPFRLAVHVAQPLPITTSAVQASAFPWERGVVVVAVVAFLAAVGYVIYRLAKRYSERLSRSTVAEEVEEV